MENSLCPPCATVTKKSYYHNISGQKWAADKIPEPKIMLEDQNNSIFCFTKNPIITILEKSYWQNSIIYLEVAMLFVHTIARFLLIAWDKLCIYTPKAVWVQNCLLGFCCVKTLICKNAITKYRLSLFFSFEEILFQ